MVKSITIPEEDIMARIKINENAQKYPRHEQSSRLCYRCMCWNQKHEPDEKRLPISLWIGICENEKSEKCMDFVRGSDRCDSWTMDL